MKQIQLIIILIAVIAAGLIYVHKDVIMKSCGMHKDMKADNVKIQNVASYKNNKNNSPSTDYRSQAYNNLTSQQQAKVNNAKTTLSSKKSAAKSSWQSIPTQEHIRKAGAGKISSTISYDILTGQEKLGNSTLTGGGSYYLPTGPQLTHAAPIT